MTSELSGYSCLVCQCMVTVQHAADDATTTGDDLVKTKARSGFLLAAAMLLSSGTLAQHKTITVAQIAPLSGPAASIGLPVTQAAHAYFERTNQSGGVNGRKIVVVERDDGFQPDRTIAEAQSVLKEHAPVAFINIIGAPNNGNLETSGLLAEHKIPVVGAFTGATSVRQLKSPYMFFIRASVADEARKMVDQLLTLGMKDVGLVHANDAFGQDAREHVERALARANQKLKVAASYEPATVDVQQAVASVRNAQPQAILIFGTGAAASKFTVEYRKSGGGAMLIANSSTSPEVLSKGAGNELARGVGLVQVVPPLTRQTIPAVREYLDTLRRYGQPDWRASPYGLEGFLAAKLLVEGLRRAGPNPSREALARALAQMGSFDAGGITLDYRAGSREGLRTVDIGIMGSDGKLMN